MSPDLFAVHNRQLVRRQALTPAEYANAFDFEGCRRPTSWLSRIFIVVAAVLLLAAWSMTK